MKKTELSILLPSLRKELAERTIREFAQNNLNCNYEVIVVSPFEIEGERVRHVFEGDKQLGSVQATRLAYKYAQSPYIMYFSDDVSPANNCLNNMLEFVKSKSEPFIGAFKMMQGNKEIGPFGAYGRLYACYGMLSKDTIDAIGGFFNSQYMYSWVDIDMSLRCWESKGKVEICDYAIVYPRQIEDDIYIKHRKETWSQDVDTFMKLWHGKLGEGLEQIEGKVNRRLN